MTGRSTVAYTGIRNRRRRCRDEHAIRKDLKEAHEFRRHPDVIEEYPLLRDDLREFAWYPLNGQKTPKTGNIAAYFAEYLMPKYNLPPTFSERVLSKWALQECGRLHRPYVHSHDSKGKAHGHSRPLVAQSQTLHKLSRKPITRRTDGRTP